MAVKPPAQAQLRAEAAGFNMDIERELVSTWFHVNACHVSPSGDRLDPCRPVSSQVLQALPVAYHVKMGPSSCLAGRAARAVLDHVVLACLCHVGATLLLD